MNNNKVILLTGAAGFIGSYLTGFLNDKGFNNIILVDAFDRADKIPNLEGKTYISKIERDNLFSWLSANSHQIDIVIHLGARTDTTEFDYAVHEKLNVEYSKKIWSYCTSKKLPLIYASSAATYGAGELGYEDSHSIIQQLRPLNPYGVSKNEFDKWALQQSEMPPFWVGLKFFNVYGPNEYHKGRMASVVMHAFNQVQKNGTVKLFRSHKPGYKDGEQLRDFIHVEDIAKVCFWLMTHAVTSGLYNLGTGQARTFNDLVTPIFHALNIPVDIQYIDMPADIRNSYQYFTEAKMNKLKDAGYGEAFLSIEEGVKDYVKDFLIGHRYR